MTEVNFCERQSLPLSFHAGVIQPWKPVENAVKNCINSLLFSKSPTPGPILSTWTPAMLAPQVVRQKQPCWYSNMIVTVMKWILPICQAICQALDSESTDFATETGWLTNWLNKVNQKVADIFLLLVINVLFFPQKHVFITFMSRCWPGHRAIILHCR